MKAHMDWSNGVQDIGGQTCGRHPPPPIHAAGNSDNIIPRHLYKNRHLDGQTIFNKKIMNIYEMCIFHNLLGNVPPMSLILVLLVFQLNTIP